MQSVKDAVCPSLKTPPGTFVAELGVAALRQSVFPMTRAAVIVNSLPPISAFIDPLIQEQNILVKGASGSRSTSTRCTADLDARRRPAHQRGAHFPMPDLPQRYRRQWFDDEEHFTFPSDRRKLPGRGRREFPLPWLLLRDDAPSSSHYTSVPIVACLPSSYSEWEPSMRKTAHDAGTLPDSCLAFDPPAPVLPFPWQIHAGMSRNRSLLISPLGGSVVHRLALGLFVFVSISLQVRGLVINCRHFSSGNDCRLAVIVLLAIILPSAHHYSALLRRS